MADRHNLGLADATVWTMLGRHGSSRPEHKLREPARRYERSCPGEFLHTTGRHY
jgi:hypothetical protein